MKTFKHISIHERMNEWMKGSMNPFPGPKQIPMFCNATQHHTDWYIGIHCSFSDTSTNNYVYHA